MTRTLSEAESKRVLAQQGVPVVDERTAPSPDAAVAAAHQLGYPVALKLCGAGIAHKTERGLLRLGLTDDASVRAAGVALLASATDADGPVELLVARMVRGTRELIAGLHNDEQFGRCVMIGLGGILAEAIGDVVFRLVPIERLDAEEMLDDLRFSAFLDEFRGEPAVDRSAVAEVLVSLSRLAESDASIIAADVNPLIVVDGRPVAVDALIEVER
jgi:acetyl-CoA synthetase (ADP-forming)